MGTDSKTQPRSVKKPAELPGLSGSGHKQLQYKSASVQHSGFGAGIVAVPGTA